MKPRKPRPVTTVAFPTALMPEIDRHAHEHGMSRSAYVQLVLRVHLRTCSLSDLEARLGNVEARVALLEGGR